MSQTPPALYPGLPSGNDPVVLPTLPKWNWGAFFLTWIWALGHRMYLIALIAFVAAHTLWPLANLLMGFLGNELAWKYRPFSDLDEFWRVQSAWTKWGVVVAVVIALLAIAAMVTFFTAIQSLVSAMGEMD